MPRVVDAMWGTVHLPVGVTDLATFRAWVRSEVLPEKLAAHFIDGDVWVDLSMGEAFSHNQAKLAVTVGLTALAAGSGMTFSDGMLFTNDEAGLGTEPDAMYVRLQSFESGRVRFAAGDTTGADATELVGSPDLVVEVVSPSSVDKDTEWLMPAYHDAGVGEYWLIDARGGETWFDIYKHGPKGFVPSRRQAGWVRTPLFGKQVRLVRRQVTARFYTFTLESR